MKQLVVVVFALIMVQITFAQASYFILIENANKQPFSIKTNEKTFEGNHFITIPKLAKGNHTLQFLLPSIKPFTITVFIDNEDLGFVLKQSNEKGYTLFNINNFKTIEADIVQKPLVSSPIITKPIETTETPIVKVIDTKVSDIKTNPNPVKEPLITPIIAPTIAARKIFENNTSQGVDRIYVVPNDNKLDTVSIFIPTLTNIKETKKVAEPAPKVTVIGKSEDLPKINTNPNCYEIFDAETFEILKQDVAKQLTDKLKQKVVSNVFDKKCFTCNQIIQLGNLFANDYYKFDFYRSAKKLISDTENYSSLQATLKEEKVKEMFTDSLNN